MVRTHKALKKSLQFQLSLLKLAVIPHGAPKAEQGSQAAMELAKLAESLPSTDKKSTRTVS